MQVIEGGKQIEREGNATATVTDAVTRFVKRDHKDGDQQADGRDCEEVGHAGILNLL